MQRRSRFPCSEKSIVSCSSARVSRFYHLCGVESIAPSSLSAHSQSILRLVKPIVLSSSDNLILLPSLVMSFVFDLRSRFPILPLSIVPPYLPIRFAFLLRQFRPVLFFAMSIIFSPLIVRANHPLWSTNCRFPCPQIDHCSLSVNAVIVYCF